MCAYLQVSKHTHVLPLEISNWRAQQPRTPRGVNWVAGKTCSLYFLLSTFWMLQEEIYLPDAPINLNLQLDK